MGVRKLWLDLSLKWKLLFLCCFSILIMAVGSYFVSEYSNRQIEDDVAVSLKGKAEDETKRIAEGVYNMVKTQDLLLKIKLRSDLDVARSVLTDAGGIKLSDEKISWTAVNQFNKNETEVSLPKMTVGSTWLGQVRGSKVRTYVVDRVQELVGGTCTIFQKMNPQGDMLRVATNVIKTDGERAIGTFIPASNPDGKANPVIESVMRGETYVGKAFVVNAWYLTAYEPIKDSSGVVQGVLYVGIPMEMVTDLRKAIQDIKVGKTGYVYVFGGTGDQKCKTVIHPSGVGGDLSATKSSDGRLIIQEIIEKGVNTKEGETSMIYYPWINAGEKSAREKMAALIYYKPWDWVIGVGAYQDEFLDSIAHVRGEFVDARKFQMVVTLLTLVFVCLLALMMVSGISASIKQGAELLKSLASSGDLSKLPDENLLERKDEVGSLARSINVLIKQQRILSDIAGALAQGDWVQTIKVKSDLDEYGKSLATMVEQVNQAMAGVKVAAEEVDSGSGQISAASQSLSQGATESAASLEEISSSITEIGGQTKANAENASQANILATQTRASAESGNQKMVDMMVAMSEIQQASNQIAKIIKVIDDIAFQTNLLSLNAAVEAARAGKHGKGFAVVADEVRNLAGRSAKAAKETSEMIENSIAKVKSGTEIAKITEGALQEIVASSVKVADLVGEIAAASNEQAQGIAQIGQGLEQIDKVTQQNTANAEETAAAAEELSGQARELNGLLGKFKVKEDAFVKRVEEDESEYMAKKQPRNLQRNKPPQRTVTSKASSGFSKGTKRAESYEKNVPAKTHGFDAHPPENKPAESKNRPVKPSDIIALDDDEFGRY